MENSKRPLHTFDLTVMELCEKVEYWKQRAEYFECLYENEREEHWKTNQEHFKTVQQNLSDTLMLCLSTVEDGNGNLIINKEDRKALVEHHSSKNI